ncbi:Alpha/Beta hydrolase fold [Phytophthora cactorum]|nr:Alpha/Beta hydrolase fold [Phytophthora cactorum]
MFISQGEDAECAIYTAPFCYPGICEVSVFAEPTVDIFAKRIPATAGDTKTAHNVWLLQGGPGYSFTAMESDMVELQTKLGGADNVCTLDYRGTGRSTLFDCVAAQITTTGSTWGRAIDPSEVPTCAKDVRMKYGDLVSFSTTSAATDISTFISKFSNGASSIVYGVSYGTVVVERLMHLNPPTVNGYVLDGIATTSGASGNNFEYYSEWDADCGEVGEHFMELCSQDSSCSSHFQSTNLSVTLHDLMMKMDNDPNSTCAKVLSN